MIQTVAQTGSTNADLAARLAAGERLAEGYWLVADRQTAGRGRLGRKWFDGAGNFMGSTVVYLGPGDPLVSTLALVAGLAVYRAVSAYLPSDHPAVLKWPNDVMIGCPLAKLAGILLERVGDAIVVGVGVNLHIAPDADAPTVALSAFGSNPPRDVFADVLAGAFAQELARWRDLGLENLIKQWSAVAYPLGTDLLVDGVNGKFDGLTPEGSLRLRLADGSVRAIHAGDVRLVD